MAKAIALGDVLITEAGGWQAAVQAYRSSWTSRFGNHLAGVYDPAVGKYVPSELWAYLQKVATEGVQSRQPSLKTRSTALPQKSLMDHLPEALRKVWKDCCKRRVLLCTTALESGTHSLLSGLACSPFGRVPKLNPDRTVSDEGRLIHDLRELNVTGHKHDHPPALQPRHHSVARLVLWWKARHPGIDILLAKRDIADAFKWLWAHDQLAGLFGTEFPGAEFGLLCSVIAISTFALRLVGWAARVST
jgi:hypothetical protein